MFIEIRLQGNVTINGNGSSAFAANNGGYLYVRSNDTSAADKYVNLTITNATYSFYATTFGNVQFRYIKTLNITCTTYAFYATVHSYVYTAGNITSFVLNAASTCATLIYANALSYVTLTFTSGACTISAASVKIGCIAYYNATVYTRYLKIPSTVTTGLSAKYGGTIIYRNITNSATTPTSAGTGSHIISY